MGGGQGKQQQRRPQQQSTPTGAKESTPKPAVQQQQTILEPVDCVIIGAPQDDAVCTVLKGKFTEASVSCYSNLAESNDASKLVGKALVDAKILVYIVSETSGKSKNCANQLSLAYISNKVIMLVPRDGKETLFASLPVNLKLTLQKFNWTVFSDNPADDCWKSFMEQVHKHLARPVQERVEVTVEPVLETHNRPYAKHLRLNTRMLRSTVDKTGSTEEVADTFWNQNFHDEDEVSWDRFKQAFLTHYQDNLKSMFTEDHDSNTSWMMEMLHDDLFGGAGSISKNHFMQVRGGGQHENAFWEAVSQIAAEKLSMKEVFDMQSTVRLTAVENLGKFQNTAVIEALLRLLEDDDPNIRAVAAISLGRTGIQDEGVIDRLIKLLKDNDRIVRQSGCLSLGALKAKKAIPYIGDRWRNDFISVVRDAARTALERMEVPEAEEVLKVTRVLEDEIKQLQGSIVQV